MNSSERVNQIIQELREGKEADIDVFSSESSYLGPNREKAYTKFYEIVQRYDKKFREAGNIHHDKKLSPVERRNCTDGVLDQVVKELQNRMQDCDKEIEQIPEKLEEIMQKGVLASTAQKSKQTIENEDPETQKDIKQFVEDVDKEIVKMKLLDSKSETAGSISTSLLPSLVKNKSKQEISTEAIQQLRKTILKQLEKNKKERTDMGLHFEEIFRADIQGDKKLKDLGQEILSIKHILESKALAKSEEERTYRATLSRLINEYLMDLFTKIKNLKLTNRSKEASKNFISFMSKNNLKIKILEAALRGIPQTKEQIEETKYSYHVSERTLTDVEFKYLHRDSFPSTLHKGSKHLVTDHKNQTVPIHEVAAFLYLAASDENLEPYSSTLLEEQREADSESIAELQAKLVRFSKTTFFSQLADIRREHNNDSPEYQQLKNQDRLSCPGGTEGRLFLRASDINKLTTFRMAPGEQPFHLIPDTLVDFIIESFTKLPIEIKKGMAFYLCEAHTLIEVDDAKIQENLKNGFDNFVKFLTGAQDKVIMYCREKLPGIFKNEYIVPKVTKAIMDVLKILLLSLEFGKQQPQIKLLESMLKNSLVLLLPGEKLKKMDEVSIAYRMKLLKLNESLTKLISQTEELTIKGLIAPSYLNNPYIQGIISTNKSTLNDDYVPEFKNLPQDLEKEVQEKNELLQGAAFQVNLAEVELIDIRKYNPKLLRESALARHRLDRLLYVAKVKQHQLETLLELSQGHKTIKQKEELALNPMLDPMLARIKEKDLFTSSSSADEKKGIENLISTSAEQFLALQSPSGVPALPVAFGETTPHYDSSPKQWALHFLRLILEKDEKGMLFPNPYKIVTSLDLMKNHFENQPNKIIEVLQRLNTYFKNYEQLIEEIPSARLMIKDFIIKELKIDLDDERFQRPLTITMEGFFSDSLPPQKKDKMKFLAAAKTFSYSQVFIHLRENMQNWARELIEGENEDSTSILRQYVRKRLVEIGPQLKLAVPNTGNFEDLWDEDEFKQFDVLCDAHLKIELASLDIMAHDYLIINIMKSDKTRIELKPIIETYRTQSDRELVTHLLTFWNKKYGIQSINLKTSILLSKLFTKLRKPRSNWDEAINDFNSNLENQVLLNEEEFVISQPWFVYANEIVNGKLNLEKMPNLTQERTIAEQLYRFVLATITVNLELVTISAQNGDNIRTLCKLYLKDLKAEDDQLPYHPTFNKDIKNKLHGLAIHISKLVENLKPLRLLFNEGFLLLISTSKAKSLLNSVMQQKPSAVGDSKQSNNAKVPFMLRIAQHDPHQCVYITWIDSSCSSDADGFNPRNCQLDIDCFVNVSTNQNEQLVELHPDFLTILSERAVEELAADSGVESTKIIPPSFDVLIGGVGSTRNNHASDGIAGDMKRTQMSMIVADNNLLKKMLSSEFSAEIHKEYTELSKRVNEQYKQMQISIEKEREELNRSTKIDKEIVSPSIREINLFSPVSTANRSEQVTPVPARFDTNCLNNHS